MSVTIPHNFEARTYQKDFFRSMRKVKRAILVWHRRAGKDVCAWNYLIKEAIKTKGIYYYIFPTAAQGRKILWDGMTNEGFRFIDFIPRQILACPVNNQEMKIRLINGSLIQIVGSDKYDSIMGTNPIGCVFSEYSIQNPNVWQYTRPILDLNNGWAIFVFTPRGPNHAKDLYDMSQSDANKSNWFTQRLTVDDTHLLSSQEIAKIKEEGMSEDMIQQEYYCSFTLGIVGSYFAKYIEEAKEDGRISKVPQDKNAKVFTSWDLGFGDFNAICFFQLIKNEIHFINYYENHGEALDHYALYLRNLPYIYDRHFAPHDVDAHELSMGLSSREVGASMGLNFTVLPTLRLSHEAGIECARSLFPRLWFDEQACKKLLIHLESYRSEYSESKGYLKSRPVHDQHSHGADSFRYAGIGIKCYGESTKGPSDDDVDRWNDIYNPRFK